MPRKLGRFNPERAEARVSCRVLFYLYISICHLTSLATAPSPFLTFDFHTSNTIPLDSSSFQQQQKNFPCLCLLCATSGFKYIRFTMYDCRCCSFHCSEFQRDVSQPSQPYGVIGSVVHASIYSNSTFFRCLSCMMRMLKLRVNPFN